MSDSDIPGRLRHLSEIVREYGDDPDWRYLVELQFRYFADRLDGKSDDWYGKMRISARVQPRLRIVK